jgi:hypothetical protein
MVAAQKNQSQKNQPQRAKSKSQNRKPRFWGLTAKSLSAPKTFVPPSFVRLPNRCYNSARE